MIRTEESVPSLSFHPIKSWKAELSDTGYPKANSFLPRKKTGLFWPVLEWLFGCHPKAPGRSLVPVRGVFPFFPRGEGITKLIVEMLDDLIFTSAPEDVTDSAWQLLIEVLCEVRSIETGGRRGRPVVERAASRFCGALQSLRTQRRPCIDGLGRSHGGHKWVAGLVLVATLRSEVRTLQSRWPS